MLRRLIFTFYICTTMTHSLAEGTGSELSARVELSLSRAQEMTLAQNREITSFRQRVREAEERQGIARSRWLPSLQLTSQITRNQESGAALTSSFTFASAQTTYFTDLSLTQPLFAPDLYHDLRIARLSAGTVGLQLLTLVNQQLFAIRDVYYQTVLAKMQLQVQQESVELLQEGLRHIETRFKVGDTTALEVNQTKVRLANALAAYFQARSTLQQARYQLVKVLGINPDQVDAVAVAEKEISIEQIPFLKEKITHFEGDYLSSQGEIARWGKGTFSEREMEVWEARALELQPEVATAAKEVATAQRRVARGRGEYLPSLNAFAGYATPFPMGGAFFRQEFEWQVGLQLRWNLFDGLGREHRIQESRASRQRALIDLERIRESVQIGIRNSFSQIEEALLSYLSAQEGVKLSDVSVAQAKERLANGVTTPLQYREVVADHTAARSNLNRASYQLLRAYYHLRQVAGVDVIDEGRG